jgi:Phosphate-induced protein 1 conserved region
MKPILFALVAASALTIGVIAQGNEESVVVKKPYDQSMNKGDRQGTGPTILYHGGPVLFKPVLPLYVIYYGMVLGTTQNIINTFLTDLNESTPFAVNTTYTQGPGGPAVSGSLGFPTIYLDSGASQGTSVGSNTVAAIIKNAIAKKLTPDSNGVYFVITAPDISVSGFCKSFCAYHTKSTTIAPGYTIHYALVPDPGQSCTGCDGNAAVYHQTVTPNGDAGADEMTDSIMHELSETATDPDLNAWYTKNGAENGDLCNYFYGSSLPTPGNGATANTILNGRYYLIQYIWRNSTPQVCANAPQ